VAVRVLPRCEAQHVKQPGAERQVVRVVKGYPSREWVKVRERKHALDCRVYGHVRQDRWLEGACASSKGTSGGKNARHRRRPNPNRGWAAYNRGLAIIAEAVETVQQLALLGELGCDAVQDYQ
jgi:hypothetical protein